MDSLSYSLVIGGPSTPCKLVLKSFCGAKGSHFVLPQKKDRMEGISL